MKINAIVINCRNENASAESTGSKLLENMSFLVEIQKKLKKSKKSMNPMSDGLLLYEFSEREPG